MKRMVLIALSLCLITPGAPAAEPAEGEAAWEMARLYLIKRGRKLSRGHALYMTDATRPALGFNCHRQKLYAFVSVVPLSLGDVLEKWFRNPAEWKATYHVDNDPVRNEKWIWTYNGKVFMSLPDDSSNYLLKAAGRGATLEFQRKGGDPVSIAIPAVYGPRFDSFIKECGLAQDSLDSASYRAARRSGVPTSAQTPSYSEPVSRPRSAASRNIGASGKRPASQPSKNSGR